MDATELETIVKNWNAETESVNVLKEAFEAFGKNTEELSTEDEYNDLWDAICYIDWAGKYAEMSFNTPFVEENGIMAIDHEGNCLCYDYDVKNISTI